MLKVLKSGFYTTIQDLGRKGFAQFGVPISGAMDLYSAQLANYILGNDLNEATIEITCGNARFQFTKPTTICVTGGDFNARLNNQPVSLNKAIFIQQDDVLSFSNKNYGMRTYLATLGGFQSEKKLNSRSFYKGITSSFILRKNDEINYGMFLKKINSFSSVKVDKSHFQTERIRCTPAPEFDLLNAKQREDLQNTLFSISNNNSRMGYQLNETIKNNFSSMLTSAVLVGTVQLTPSGKLIVLMRDCQVTGGYPRILQLSEHAINQLSQKSTKDTFKFVITQLY